MEKHSEVNKKSIIYPKEKVIIPIISLLLIGSIILSIVFRQRAEAISAEQSMLVKLWYGDEEEVIPMNILIDDEEALLEEELLDNEVSEENTTPTQSSPSPYYIKVNYTANCVTIYTKDANGNYTVPFKAMICSTGDYTPPCSKYPDLIYKLDFSKRYPKGTWGAMEGGVYARYWVRITGGILFHSVPYFSQSKSNLEYEEYDKLGTRASAGCVRLQVNDAKWIYDNIPTGTYVEFYSSSDPGPLGKPTAKYAPISSNVANRGWDPNDWDPKNPWNGYVAPQYTLSFDTCGGTAVAALRREEGTVINLDNCHTFRDGYRFDGWFIDSSYSSPVSQIVLNGNKTVYAKWTKVNNYTIEFKTNGGTPLSTITVNEGDRVELSGYTTTKSGYTFGGWYADSTLNTRVTAIVVQQNTIVYASWIKDSTGNETSNTTVDTNTVDDTNTIVSNETNTVTNTVNETTNETDSNETTN